MTISVLITTYHRDALLDEALQSLYRQTFHHWEALVVDNAHSPETREVVLRANDDRIRYLSPQRNLGECAGRNFGFSFAKGDFICYLDDDDLLPPDSLALRLDFMLQNPACGMIYGEYERFGDQHDTITNSCAHTGYPFNPKRSCDQALAYVNYAQNETYYFLTLFNFVRGGTPLIRRSVFEAVGGFDERYPVYGDYDLWLSIARQYAIRFLNKVVYRYRTHPGSTSERFFATGCDKPWALLLCRKHSIRRNFQFARYRGEIAAMYSLASQS